jgi:PST family polysaccharide transporter
VSEASGSLRPAVKAAAASGTASITSAFVGVVRVKLYAVFLGTAGVGVISQVQALQNTLAVLSSLGMGIGISREVARARGRGDEAGARSVLRTARALGLGTALLMVAAVALAARPVASVLLGDPAYAPLFLLAVPALVPNTLSRILGDVLNGRRDVRANAIIGITTSLLGIAILPVLLWRLGLAGAALSLSISALASWIVIAAILRRRHPDLRGAGIAVDRPLARTLLGIGAASLLLAAIDQVIVLVMRARLIAQTGVHGNGLFQGVWGLSQYSLNIAVAFLTTYAFARVQESRDPAVLRRETNHALRTTLLMMAPLSAGLVLGRRLLIEVFLSREFAPAAPLVAWQATGDLLRAAGGAAGVGLLAVVSPGVWIAVGLCGSLSFIGTFMLLVGRTGILAGSQAWMLSGLIYLVVTCIVMRRRSGLRFDPRLRLLALSSAMLLGAMILIADGSLRSYLVGVTLLLAWGATAVRPSEVRGAWTRALARLRRG